ncbi:F-box protein [Raphanus sativus]|nr:F-box protein [Raphanus sativus]
MGTTRGDVLGKGATNKWYTNTHPKSSTLVVKQLSCQGDEELYLKEEELYLKEYVDSRLYIAVSTVSRQVLKVVNVLQKSKRWLFLVYKMHPVELTWEVVDSLGDEALIIDMGITVVAKDVPEIKRNSIYFSGLDDGRKES